MEENSNEVCSKTSPVESALDDLAKSRNRVFESVIILKDRLRSVLQMELEDCDPCDGKEESQDNLVERIHAEAIGVNDINEMIKSIMERLLV